MLGRRGLGLAHLAHHIAETLKDGARADVVLVLPAAVAQSRALYSAQNLPPFQFRQLVDDLSVSLEIEWTDSRRGERSPRLGWASTSTGLSCS